MQPLSETLVLVLRQPNVDNLIALQEAVLSCLPPSTERDTAMETIGHFYEYLLGLQQKLTARQYSELASWLDISAVGLVAFESLLARPGLGAGRSDGGPGGGGHDGCRQPAIRQGLGGRGA